MRARCKASEEICQRGAQVWEAAFAGKHPVPRPRALVVMGPQGAGKSTFVDARPEARRGYVVVNPGEPPHCSGGRGRGASRAVRGGHTPLPLPPKNRQEVVADCALCVCPDTTLVNLVGRKAPLPDHRPDGSRIFDFARDLSQNILEEAVAAGYNLVVDMALPSHATLAMLKRRGYRVDFALMRLPAKVARGREVRRDIRQLGWGRPGISSASQKETAAALAEHSESLVRSYGTGRTIRCDNRAEVMKCSDGTRVLPKKGGPDTRVK